MDQNNQKTEGDRNFLSKLFSKNNIMHSAKCNQIHGYVKRADTEKLKDIFNKYASVEREGEQFMTASDFIIEYLGIKSENKDTCACLAGCADTTKDGLISFIEFQAFESLLSAPDAIFALAFQLFDTNSSGHDFHEEYTLQAFHAKDYLNSGYITAVDFYDIMSTLKDHLLTNFVKDNLLTVAGGGKGTTNISYPFFTACISLLDNMDLVKLIYSSGCSQIGNIEMTKEEFLREAQNYSKVTPLEVEILFQLIDLQHQNGRIQPADLNMLAPIEQEHMPYSLQRRAIQEMVQEQYEGGGRGFLVQVMESGYRFILGAISGAMGATAVYPIDLVKTRMQNQRTGGAMVGELMYKNSFDCFKKVIRYEGLPGLYRGLVPQLVGVAPEKAIKLTMNDFVRGKMTRKDGSIPLYGEILAGCCAGGSQVIVTNPLEIVKIRLQVAGEVIQSRKISAISVIKELGLFGLYKGSSACFLRDIPFSGIYFSTYAALKRKSANEKGENSPLTLFLSATLSGAPAACLTTPADVIKTRLQVVARQGQTSYSGMFDTARKIYRQEGTSAFFKGAPARVLRSSPQFGVTLLMYETLQKFLYIDFGNKLVTFDLIVTTVKHKNQQVLPDNADHIGGYRLAMATFQGLEVKYGICLPKFAGSGGV